MWGRPDYTALASVSGHFRGSIEFRWVARVYRDRPDRPDFGRIGPRATTARNSSSNRPFDLQIFPRGPRESHGWIRLDASCRFRLEASRFDVFAPIYDLRRPDGSLSDGGGWATSAVADGPGNRRGLPGLTTTAVRRPDIVLD